MNANIHIVEDEQSIVTLVEYNLNKEGFKVNSSTNGEDGFKAIKDTNPDLVLMDWMLPDLSGVEICKLLKKNDKYKNNTTQGGKHIENSKKIFNFRLFLRFLCIFNLSFYV